tara:strand:- start:8704 stop:9495 length:792 start_codon:yes stop_codon:yes gene_type:complete
VIKYPKYNIFCSSSQITLKDYVNLTDYDLGIGLYCINLSHYTGFVSRLKPFLNSEEVSRATRYYNNSDRNRFIICRTVLKFLLSKCTGLNIKEIFFDKDDNKKPYLSGYESISFNVTHAGDYAIIAIAKNPIGVDIEYVNKDFDYKEILPNIFNKAEIDEVVNSHYKHCTFYKLWTRKEAIVKATGKGIDDNFSEIASLDGYHYMRSELLGTIKNLQVLSFELDEGYLGAVAFSDASEYKGELFFYPMPATFQEFLNTEIPRQ